VVGLRRREGIDREAFRLATGLDADGLIGPALDRWLAGGLAQDDGRRIRLTREGLLVSDSLWAAVLRP
jgi:oxygen-independent coproporphyrinogen-3 oxidase